MRHALIALMLAASPLAAAAETLPAPVEQQVPGLEKSGEGRLNFLFFDIYDAELFLPEGGYSPEKPFALRMNYLRNLSKDELVENIIDQLKKHKPYDSETLKKWEQTLINLMPSVKEGTEITGLSLGDGTSQFFRGNEKIGTVTDKSLTRAFFGLWLDNPPAVPERLRAQLLGQ